MAISLTDKVALVTGGARGIGAGMVRALADAGAKVMIADIGVVGGDQSTQSATSWRYKLADASDLTSLQSESVAATYVDVTDAASCEAAVAATLLEFGRLDILINNAGIVDSGPIETFDEAVWDRIFAVNSKGIFLMCQAALAALGEAENACVINTASIAGKQGYANMSAYCGSKFAAIGITQALAAEFAPMGIRVNALCPGMVGTAMWLDHLLPSNATSEAQRGEEFAAAMENAIPLGRPQTAEDMGEAVIYLATAPNVTGIALSVDGGVLQR